LVNDADAQVRMQLAYTLGEWPDERSGDALARLALKDAGDRYLTAAVLSSVTSKNLERVLRTVFATDRAAPPPPELAENLLRVASALGDARSTGTLLATLATPEKGRYAVWQYAAVAGLLDALDQRGRSLKRLWDDGDDELKGRLQKLAPLFAAARAAAVAPKAEFAERQAALRLLGRGLDRQAEDVKTLAGLLTPQTPADVQAAAAASL